MVDTEPEAESDLRRRAAWLLVMLAVVAVLFIIVIGALVKTDDKSSSNDGPRSLDSAINGQPSHSTSKSTHPRRHHRTSTAPRSTTSSTPPVGTTSCPTSQTCILEGDIGNGIQAVNDYRTQHGKPAVTGTVSPLAQTCAVNNGSGCSGGWAETELATPDGAEAVHKMLAFSHVLDPMKSFEVGWAYDPTARLYYFAFIRNS